MSAHSDKIITMKTIGRQLSLARTQSLKACEFCHEPFQGIKIAAYCSESCRQKATCQRNKARLNRGGTRLSEGLGMARPYDWSNRNMPSKAFIVSVLNGGLLQDIAKCIRYFGSRKVTACLNDVTEPLSYRMAARKVRNATLALERDHDPISQSRINGTDRPSMLALNPVFKSKAVALMDSVKSRDLFDLMILITRYNYTVDDIIDALITIDERDEVEAETVLEVLVGNVSVDKDDPGFESTSLDVTLKMIYQTFDTLVNDYEQRAALRI